MNYTPFKSVLLPHNITVHFTFDKQADIHSYCSEDIIVHVPDSIIKGYSVLSCTGSGDKPIQDCSHCPFTRYCVEDTPLFINKFLPDLPSTHPELFI